MEYFKILLSLFILVLPFAILIGLAIDKHESEKEKRHRELIIAIRKSKENTDDKNENYSI